MAVAAMTGGGCAVRTQHQVRKDLVRPALDSTPETLLAGYNQQARGVRSLNAAVRILTTAGSTYSGVIEEYHEISGFVLAQKPANIRMIGQAPFVATKVFDMVSDGQTFRIFIPPKGKFIVGPTAVVKTSKKPLENLRPQHLVDALFWPEITAGETVLFEEWNAPPDRYYILTVLRPGPAPGTARPEIARKLWFDRVDLSLARVQTYESGGRLATDVTYAGWQPAGELRYPRQVVVNRPREDYTLDLNITRLQLNEEISADRFQLEQPPGSELVRVGEGQPTDPGTSR
jgi:outer membrane lipoprotein-sorting protein